MGVGVVPAAIQAMAAMAVMHKALLQVQDQLVLAQVARAEAEAEIVNSRPAEILEPLPEAEAGAVELEFPHQDQVGLVVPMVPVYLQDHHLAEAAVAAVMDAVDQAACMAEAELDTVLDVVDPRADLRAEKVFW